MSDIMVEMRTIPVEIPGHEYSIHVQAGLLERAGLTMRRISRSNRVGLVSDAHVWPLHGQAMAQSFEAAGFDVVTAIIEPGEEHKTLTDVSGIYDKFLSANIERTTPVVALGGGIVGDMAGFVAATLLRGVPFVQIPTSLLAMVDASIGGKTGVNHSVGKNLIGAVYQPRVVLIDPVVLSTLPDSELRGGLAECIKHEVIRDAAGFARLEEHIDEALAKDIHYLTELVAHNVAIKADVVSEDPFEQGARAHLNFGHTFGHAIETATHHGVSHGEAVALGMVAACRLAVSLGTLEKPAAERISRLIDKAGLPTSHDIDVDEVVRLMSFDKKVKAGRLRFILPEAIGTVTIRDDVPVELVREAVASLRG